MTAGWGLGGGAPPRAAALVFPRRAPPTPTWPGPATPEFTERETEAWRGMDTVRVTYLGGVEPDDTQRPASQPRANTQMTHSLGWAGMGRCIY